MSAKTPEDKLQYRLCVIQCMIKMKMYEGVVSEFRDIGAFDDPKHITQEPSSEQLVSMVPPAMRLLYALLPAFQGKDQKTESLSTLLAYFMQKEISKSEATVLNLNNPPSYTPTKPTATTTTTTTITNDTTPTANTTTITPTNESINVSLINQIKFSLINVLCSDGELFQAISLACQITQTHSQDVFLLFCIARMHLQVGNTNASDIIFSRIESLISTTFPGIIDFISHITPESLNSESEKYDELQNNDSNNSNNSNNDSLSPMISFKQAILLILNIRGLQSFSKGIYGTAVNNYQKILELDEGNNAMAVNNLSVCHLYNGQLHQGIKVIENYILNDTAKHLSPSFILGSLNSSSIVDGDVESLETLVFNLCTLYDLAYNDSISKRKTLFQQMHPHLPDNFDVNHFRLPELTDSR
eukprot:TRINITY_DN411_c4_g1_i1.p1 TRINITY_DN411_c4_g1~~TRINITY_DN411_c4_g1_i1.p1  ORF type:complete len:479 (+),score=109.79 TRINITY_DN411_c4_g1_i1:195-1439(+)